MAVNKRKILETAQKFLQKGALDKALKEYKTLLDLDPRDTSARLKLGDIHLRLGEKLEGVAAYTKVAQQFMKDGFDAKAVALFKQIAKLAPEQTDIYVPLAELYQRLGLTAEAMSALQAATEVFQKAGRKREALELLRKAASLDPTNTTSRLKIADLLRQQGMAEEALAEYDEVAAELGRSGEAESLASVYERILEIEPERIATLVALARVSMECSNFERACELAQRACVVRPDLVEAHELHADALQALGRDASDIEPIYRTLAELHRARGDEERAREILQRFLPGNDLTRNGDEAILADVTEQGFLGSALDEEPAPAEAASSGSAPAQAAPPADEALEQRVAEASVYLRFGKRDRAISGLESVLDAAPDHAGALEILAGAVAEHGDAERAAQLLGRAARVQRSFGNEAEAERLESRAVHLGAAPTSAAASSIDGNAGLPTDADVADEALGGGVGIADSAEAEGIAAPVGEPEFEFEVELDLSGTSESPLATSAAGDSGATRAVTDGLEIELGPDEELAAERQTQPFGERSLGASASRRLPTRVEIPTEDELAASFSAGAPLEESAAPERLPEPSPLAAPPPLDPGLSRSASASASPQQILEDLEEADFYFQQGLFEEAEAVYRRILEVAPTNPQALLRLGEIAAARGQDPGSSRQIEPLGPAAVLEPLPLAPVASDEAGALGDDLAEWDPQPAAGEPDIAPPSLEIGLDDEPAFETESFDAEGLEGDDAATAPPGEDTGSPQTTPAEASQTDEAISGPLPIASHSPEAGAPEAVASVDETREISHFDLAAELSDALASDEPGPAAETTAPAMGEENLEALFSEFKRGVSKTLTAADHETHYDLGIAYREMELYEDAMGEFQIALESPSRRIDCLQLLGLCARELKRPHDAVAFFRQALSEPDLPVERRAAIGFDLGIALEESGDAPAALTALDEVVALDPEFPNATERIEALRGLLAISSGESAPDETQAAAEVYESFDDLIAQAEAANVAEGARDDAAEREGDPSESATLAERQHGGEPVPPSPRGTPPRRRKISFG